MSLFLAHLVYALAWLSFGVVHSYLARPAVIATLKPVFRSAYRLIYNLIALIHIGLVFWVGQWAFADAPALLPDLAGKVLVPAGWAVTAWGLVLLAMAMQGYDTARFMGTAQIRAAKTGTPLEEDEPLQLSGLHRHVRHPLYSAAFLILWGMATSWSGLALAVWGSVYLVIGTWYEERKLIDLYGPVYQRYRQRVPAYIPRRGRSLAEGELP
ncbi:MAG: methyltransferase family protein [Rhodospirillaceae bacterium]